MCLENIKYSPPQFLWGSHICFYPLLDIGIKIIVSNHSKQRISFILGHEDLKSCTEKYYDAFKILFEIC